MSDDSEPKPKRTKMSKDAYRLTANKIEKLKGRGRHHDGNGLYLQITRSGSRSWLLRYQVDGRDRMLGLGPLHTFSLKEARDRAKAARQQVHDGVNPVDQRRAKRAQAKSEAAQLTTFKQASERYIAAHEGAWGNAVHRHQWRQTLEQYAFPVIGDLSVAAINTDFVLKVLEPIWANKTSTAGRLRGRIEKILDWAKARQLREGENPARWRGHLDNLLQKPTAAKSHHAAMAVEDIPAFVAELRTCEGVAPRALEVAILTGLRTGEVLRAKWLEINLAKREWVIPAERMKAGKEHKVPLSERAVEILSQLPRETDNEFVFIGEQLRRPINSRALFTITQEMRFGLTVHGFRSSFSDWAHERTNTSSHVVEMALAHAVGSAVERAYRRGDLFEKRRQLMDAWAHFCTHPEASGEVVQLFGGA